MADVTDIADYLPKPDPAIVESLKIMLAEAQAGRMVGFAAVSLTEEDGIVTVFHFARALDAVGATAHLHRDALECTAEE